MYHFVKYRCQFVGLYVYIPKNVVTMVICHLSKSISGWVKIRTIVYKYIFIYYSEPKSEFHFHFDQMTMTTLTAIPCYRYLHV